MKLERRVAKLERVVMALVAEGAQPPPEKPKFKVGDVCWWSWRDGQVRIIAEILSLRENKVRYGLVADGRVSGWVYEKELTLIPQPARYGVGEKNPPVSIGDTFVVDGVTWKIVAARVPVDNIDKWVGDGGGIAQYGIGSAEFKIRFIVEEVEPEFKEGWWCKKEKGFLIKYVQGRFFPQTQRKKLTEERNKK